MSHIISHQDSNKLQIDQFDDIRLQIKTSEQQF